MSLRRWLLAGAAVIAAALATPALADEGYVPDDGWPTPNTEAIIEQFLGEALTSLGEPQISTVPLPEGIAERFRMTIMQSFQAPLTIRIERTTAGVTTIRASEAGETRVLTETEVAAFQQVLATQQFSRFDYRHDERPPPRARTGCLDGYSIYYELHTPDESSFVIARCPLRDDFRATTRSLLDLAGLPEAMQDL